MWKNKAEMTSALQIAAKILMGRYEAVTVLPEPELLTRLADEKQRPHQI